MGAGGAGNSSSKRTKVSEKGIGGNVVVSGCKQDNLGRLGRFSSFMLRLESMRNAWRRGGGFEGKEEKMRCR